MSTVTPSRLGQSNGSGDALALFLKVFPGEILRTFEAIDKITPLHTVRTIASGKSAQFPVIGTTNSGYHIPGAEIAGEAINHAEKVINVDQLLIASAFIPSIDEAMNHYDVRGPYAEEIANALYDAYARRVWRTIVRSARTDAFIDGTRYAMYGSSGANTAAGETYNADLRTADGSPTAAHLIDKIWKAHKILDDKNIPKMGRRIGVNTLAYYLLMANGGSLANSVINKDWGGEGSYARGEIGMIGGAPIIDSVQFPDELVTEDTAAATGGNNYNGDFTNTLACVFHPRCAGTVKLLDLAVESDYLIKNQGWFTVAKYAMGHGVVAPACSTEIVDGSTQIDLANYLPTA